VEAADMRAPLLCISLLKNKQKSTEQRVEVKFQGLLCFVVFFGFFCVKAKVPRGVK
jgi:hypothetical protein